MVTARTRADTRAARGRAARALFVLATLSFGAPVMSVGAQAPRVAPAADSASLRREIEQLHERMVAALKQDPASVARFYTDDAQIVGGGARHVGREQIDRYWAGGAMFADWKLETLEVGGSADAPWMHGRSTLTGKSGRTMATEFVGVLRRGADGTLKYYIDLYTGAPGTAMVRQP